MGKTVPEETLDHYGLNEEDLDKIVDESQDFDEDENTDDDHVDENLSDESVEDEGAEEKQTEEKEPETLEEASELIARLKKERQETNEKRLRDKDSHIANLEKQIKALKQKAEIEKKLIKEVDDEAYLDPDKREEIDSMKRNLWETEKEISDIETATSSINKDSRIVAEIPDYNDLVEEMKEIVKNNPQINIAVKAAFDQDPLSTIRFGQEGQKDDIAALKGIAETARGIKRYKDKIAQDREKSKQELANREQRQKRINPAKIPVSNRTRDSLPSGSDVHGMSNDQLDKIIADSQK